MGPLSLGLANQIRELKATLKQIDTHEKWENDKLTDDLLGKIKHF
jgi:hypothetical protein